MNRSIGPVGFGVNQPRDTTDGKLNFSPPNMPSKSLTKPTVLPRISHRSRPSVFIRPMTSPAINPARPKSAKTWPTVAALSWSRLNTSNGIPTGTTPTPRLLMKKVMASESVHVRIGELLKAVGVGNRT